MDLLLRTRRGLGLLLFCACALLHVSAAHALPIAIDEQQRSVAADAAASNSAENDSETDADETLLPGVASLEAGADASVLDATAASDATQQSDVAVAQLSGVGAAESGSDAPGATAFAFGSAESQLRIVFTATSDASLRLTGRIDATGSGAGDASALIELSAIDPTQDPLLLLFEVGPGESLDIDAVAALLTGVEYRLIALARASSDALDGETGAAYGATFRLKLSEIPEPGTALTLTLGLVALLVVRR